MFLPPLDNEKEREGEAEVISQRALGSELLLEFRGSSGSSAGVKGGCGEAVVRDPRPLFPSYASNIFSWLECGKQRQKEGKSTPNLIT
jgi:hypothetical protein